MLLRDQNGLAYEEIAKITEVPIGTVKSRVNRGRLCLRRDLEELRDEVMGTGDYDALGYQRAAL